MSRSSQIAQTRVFEYALEQLLVDQDRDWVIDTIPAVLAWVEGGRRKKVSQPFIFSLDHTEKAKMSTLEIALRWDTKRLTQYIPGVLDHARRLREKRSAQREHVTELAAYGLTFVAISVLMPGRRVKTMRMGSSPDILFDDTPAALRGVETAGHSTGGRAALLTVRNGTPDRPGKRGSLGKAMVLINRADIAEVHLSLWCSSPRASIMEQLKP